MAARAAKSASLETGLKAILSADKAAPVVDAKPPPAPSGEAAAPTPPVVAPDTGTLQDAKPPAVEDKPDADTAKRLDVLAKADKRNREREAEAKADLAMQVAAFERKQAEFTARSAEFDALRSLAKKNPLEALKKLGLESEDDYEAVARSTYPLSKTGKTDPKAKSAADAILKDRESTGTVAELRQQIADLKSMVEGKEAERTTQAFVSRYLDEAVKAVPSESHAALALKANPERTRNELLALGRHMEAEAMRADGVTKYAPEYTPTHAAVVAEYEKRTVADLKDRGFTDAEITARLKPAKTVAAAAPSKTLDIGAPTSTRIVDPNPDRKARLAAIGPTLNSMLRPAT